MKRAKISRVVGSAHTVSVGALLCALAVPLPIQARELLVAGREPALVDAVCARLDDSDVRPASEVHPSRGAKLARLRMAAQEQLQAARDAYARGDIDGAKALLNEAIQGCEQAFAGLDDLSQLARAYLLRADLALASEDTASAEDSFMVAARYLGAVELDPNTNSPLVVEGFNTARELIENSPTGELSVSAALAGIEITIDGQARGEAPIKVALPPGPHLVQARLDGYGAWAQQIPIDPGATREVEIILDRLEPLEQALHTLSSEDVHALRELDPDRDWLLVLREGDGLRYSLLLHEQEDRYSDPVTLEELPDALVKDGWSPSLVSLEEIGLIAAGVGAGVAGVSLVSALTLDSVMMFTDLGSGDDRATMQLAERALLGVAVAGAVVGAAGAGLWLYLEREALFGGEDAADQPASAATPADEESAESVESGEASEADAAADAATEEIDPEDDEEATTDDLLNSVGAAEEKPSGGEAK